MSSICVANIQDFNSLFELVLVWFGWGVLGGLVGLFGVIGCIVLNFFAEDPDVN